MPRIDLISGSDFRHMGTFALGGYLLTQLIYEAIIRPPYPFLVALILLPPFALIVSIVWVILGRRLYRPKGLALRIVIGIVCAFLTAFLTSCVFFSVAELSDFITNEGAQLGEMPRGAKIVLFYSLFGVIYSLPGVLIFGSLLGVSAHRRMQARDSKAFRSERN